MTWCGLDSFASAQVGVTGSFGDRNELLRSINFW
jgi:hypothetical protein